VNEQYDICGVAVAPSGWDTTNQARAKSSPCTAAQRKRADKRKKAPLGASTSLAACKSLCHIPDNPSPHGHHKWVTLTQ
jgi:hypothetical protein